MKKRIWVCLLSLLLLAACGAGAGVGTPAASAETPEPVPAAYAGRTNPYGGEALSAGAEVFKTYCASCHGEYGRGDGVAGASLEPRPKNLVELQPLVGDDFLFWRISTGKPGTSMVAWGGILTEEQIWQVVVYIRALK